MNQTIKIKNEVDTTIIDIEGTIGVPESWQCDSPQTRVTTYERFKESVSRIADISNSTIRVNIRSTGGDVNDAMLIYEALRATGAKITTCCYGYTASAATIVAQAASRQCVSRRRSPWLRLRRRWVSRHLTTLTRSMS